MSGSCKDVVAPIPVASISVSETVLDLVPAQAVKLTAATYDNGGDALTRDVTWSSSAPSIATVVSGLVTGVAPGAATITASSEGKSSTVSVSVEEGGLLGPAGGNISAFGGTVQITVPAAAVAISSRLFIFTPTDFPATVRLLPNSVFELTAEATTQASANADVPAAIFTQPATLTIHYSPSDLNGRVESSLGLYEDVAGKWQEVDASVVDVSQHTVSGRFTGAGIYAILSPDAVTSLTVAPDTIAIHVRDKVTFTVTLRDADGVVLSGRVVTWASTNPAVVTIDANAGAANGVSPGGADIVATSEGISAHAVVNVSAGPPSQIAGLEGDQQTALVGTTLPISPAVVVSDADGFPVSGAAVTFSVTAGGGTITGADATTNASGIARVGSWTLGNDAGSNVLAAIAAGTTASVLFTATSKPKPPPPPAVIAIFAGDGQQGDPGKPVAIPPAVKVTDAAGNPVRGALVTFSIRSGDGSLTGPVATSDANGIATVGSWILGSVGGNSLFAALPGTTGSPLIFIATARAPPPAPPAAIAINGGDGQTVRAGTSVPIPPSVKVTDAQGQAVSGIVITFSIRSGDGSITQPKAISNINGIATLGSWTLGAAGGQSLFATLNGVAGSPLVFVAMATLPPTADVHVVTFGDSNTDIGFIGTNPVGAARSYVSSAEPRVPPGSPNNPYQLAGKIEAKWRARSTKSIIAVNHGISATSSGDGRTGAGAPNARTQVNSVTRFEGEVLGTAYPWSGGEPVNGDYQNGAIPRVLAFTPGANDFAYVSMGTNDPGASLSDVQTGANLNWMIDQWVNSGHAANHFILTTLAPSSQTSAIPAINTQIRAIAVQRGVRLVDLAGRTSDDNGATWRSPLTDNIGDGLHYSEVIRDWLADQVVSYMLTLVP
jgi:uncharacterized protein YjdB